MTVLVVGCKQQEDLKPAVDASAPAITRPFESMSQAEQIVYYKANLNSLGQVAARLGKEADFRKLVYDKIEERFDGDYNVLFSQLGEATLNGAKVLDRMQQASASGRASATSAMNAFTDRAGDGFFPQVFIPFYKQLKEAGKIGKQPVEIVIHPGNDNVNEAPGYTLNERSELVPTGKMVDEAYLLDNEVWVISLNERALSLAEIETFEAKASGKTDKAARTQAGPGFQFEWMRLKEHMENVFSGQNDIRFSGVMDYASGAKAAARVTPENGCHIAYWSKSETQGVNDPDGSRGIWKTVYWQNLERLTATSWQTPDAGLSPATGDWLWFTLFEHDAAPVGIQGVEITNPQSQKVHTVSYRSSEGPCVHICLSTNPTSYYYMGSWVSWYNTDRVEWNIIPK